MFFACLCLAASVVSGASGWLSTVDGCAVWSGRTGADLSVTWSGRCTGGKADGLGIGTWQWTESGMPAAERFQGEMRNGMLREGVFEYANGDRYEGGFQDNKKTGQGVYTTALGDRYDGEFLNDQLHGRGAMVWADGRRYEGGFDRGRINGYGFFTWSDGRRFEGRFIDGVPHGFGQCRNRDGEWGDCEFRDGEFLGWR